MRASGNLPQTRVRACHSSRRWRAQRRARSSAAHRVAWRATRRSLPLQPTLPTSPWDRIWRNFALGGGSEGARVPGSYDRVLAGIRAAQAAGLGPVKVNCVLLRGFNDDQIVAFVHFAREEDVIVRFIEFMPLEEDRIWSRDTVIGYDETKARMTR